MVQSRLVEDLVDFVVFECADVMWCGGLVVGTVVVVVGRFEPEEVECFVAVVVMVIDVAVVAAGLLCGFVAVDLGQCDDRLRFDDAELAALIAEFEVVVVGCCR